MIWTITAATLFVVAIFGFLLALHLRMVRQLREEYEHALSELEKHPESSSSRSACESAGRSYYRFLRIKEHATLADFPMPYTDTPDMDDDLVARDIATRLHRQQPAA